MKQIEHFDGLVGATARELGALHAKWHWHQTQRQAEHVEELVVIEIDCAAHSSKNDNESGFDETFVHLDCEGVHGDVTPSVAGVRS